MLWKAAGGYEGPDQPTHLRESSTPAKKTFRNKIYKEYKAKPAAAVRKT